MTTVANAQIQYESSQTLVNFVAMTDSGDHKIFTSAAEIWSGRSEYAPDVRPDGIVSGVDILTAGSGNDEVDSIGFTAWLAGVLKLVSATTTTITRPSSSTHVINSIILTDSTVSAVKGTEGSAFSTTRGAAGGPPYIPVGSIEIGQVKTSAQASAVLTSSEIFQIAGTHQERADWPLYRKPRNYGYGINTSVTAKKTAHIEFHTAHDLSHTGDVCKGIYIKYYTPTFTTISTFNGFTPAEISSSQLTENRFNEIFGHKRDGMSVSKFKAEVQDGITDSIIALDGETLIIKTIPDAAKDPYMLTLGTLRFLSSLPQAGDIHVQCIVAVKFPTARFAS